MEDIGKYNIKQSSKERDLMLANAMQRRLVFPKFGLYGIVLIVSIAFIYKIYTGEELIRDNSFGLFFIYYMAIVIPISAIITIIFGICPHCHKTQGLNGKVVSFTGTSFSISRGVSPFIKYCARCGAPLSRKAVEETYKKYEQEQQNINEEKHI